MSIKAVSWALEQDVSDPIAKLVLIGLADRYNDERGIAWPAIKWLAIAGSCSDRTVTRKLSKLEELGLISINRRFNDTSTYGISAMGGGDTALSGGDSLSGGDTALSLGGDTALTSGGDSSCLINNKNNNNNKPIKEKSGKQKLSEWEPTQFDKEYAESLELDWQEILTDMRLWDEKGGNKAAYASCKAFWQTWCRKEGKSSQRRLNRQQSASGGKSKVLSEGQKVFADNVTQKYIKAFGSQGFAYKMVLVDVEAFMLTKQTDDDWMALGNGLPSPRDKGWM